MSEVTTFVEACVRGQARIDEVDDWVDRWHDAEGDSDIATLSHYAYLGLSWDEYGRWLRDASALEGIVAEHQRRQRGHLARRGPTAA
jgi:hypothetical protein